MTSTDIYRLALPLPQRIIPFAVMGVLSAVGVGFLISILAGAVDRALMVVMVGWCAILVWNWNVLLRIPYEIRFESVERISFVALARTWSLNVADIRSIKPYASAGGLYILRHTNGKIRLMSQFTGFHEVVARIKAANPGVEIVGI